MELRHHPLLSYHGIPSWPPVWSPAKPREGKQLLKVLKGEIGVLKYTLANATSEKCFLVIEYDHIPYVGCLLCSDLAFSTQLASILHTQSGRTIQEIGDLDLDFIL